MTTRTAAINIAKRMHQILVMFNDEDFCKKAAIDTKGTFSNTYGINIWRDDPIMNDTYGMLSQLPSWENTFEENILYFNPRKDLDKFNQLTYVENTGKYNTVIVDDFKTMNTDEYYFQQSLLYEEHILDVLYILAYFRSTDIDYSFSFPIYKVPHYEVWINEILQRDF